MSTRFLARDPSPEFGFASIESFVNLERTTEGGTHVRGFVLGLAAGFKQAAPEACAKQTLKQIERALGWGLVATVRVRLGDPRFGGSTKDCLVSPGAQRAEMRRHGISRVSGAGTGDVEAVRGALRQGLARRVL